MRPRHAVAAWVTLVLAVVATGFVAMQTPAPAEHLGTVHFPVSCGAGEQPAFDQATARLHTLDYIGAARAYAAIAHADPDCAMAFWGIAMSNLKRPIAAAPSPRDLQAVREALIPAAAAREATPRERAYVAAVGVLAADGAADWRQRTLAYERAMRALAARYPDDKEATIFYALALNMASPPDSPDFTRRTRATELLLVVLSEQPDHPGIAHYLTYCLTAAADASRDVSPQGRVAMDPRLRRILLAGLGTLILSVFGTLLALGPPTWPQAMADTPVPIGGPFALTGSDGQKVTDATFRGKWLLLYFGYTNCPDICPTTLNDIAETLARLGPAADRVQPLFVTIDPERDTPAAIGAYVKNFDPRIVGLTGTPAQVAVAAKAYRVYYRKEKQSDAAGGYLMQHSAFIYVVAPDGRYVTLFSPLQGQGPEQMAAKLRELLSQAS